MFNYPSSEMPTFEAVRKFKYFNINKSLGHKLCATRSNLGTNQELFYHNFKLYETWFCFHCSTCRSSAPQWLNLSKCIFTIKGCRAVIASYPSFCSSKQTQGWATVRQVNSNTLFCDNKYQYYYCNSGADLNARCNEVSGRLKFNMSQLD